MGTAEKILLNYSGSTALSFLCDLTTLSIDQVNFIVCQIIALCFSISMKKWIRDPQTKLIYSLICGLGICLFCFGNQIFHIIISAGVGYIIISTNKSSHMPWVVLSASMFYLSSLHLQRQFFDELGSYTLDITGPLMVLTQKVTSLAFSLQDAVDQKKDDEKSSRATEMQKKYAVVDYPTFLEYWSYVFQFQSMLAGPLILFKDFREFIHTNEFPSPLFAVVKKLGVSVFFAVVFIKVTPTYSVDKMKESDFLWDTTFMYRMFYVTIATMMERAKYYHAWQMAEAVCNASGLGYDSKSQRWDLVTNVDALGFELGLNLKESLDCWNKGTMKWLRHVVYERANPKIRTVATYAMSAIWHGFYPGYYMTFLSGALFTSAARQVRKTIRPLCLNDKGLKFVYDFGTWLTTRFVVAYVTFSFIILDFTPSMLLYVRLFFCLHFAAFGAMFALPKLSKHLIKSAGNSSSRNTQAKSTIHEESEAPLINTGKALKVPKEVQSSGDDSATKVYHAKQVIDPVILPTLKPCRPVGDFTGKERRRRADHQVENSFYQTPPAKNTRSAKDIILENHEFPEIASYLGSNGKSPTNDKWSSWTSQTINGNTAVQLKTG